MWRCHYLKRRHYLIAKTLIKRHHEKKLEHTYLENSFWAQNLFKRMKFVRYFGTTGKVSSSESIRKKVEISYLHVIVRTNDIL